MTLADPDHRATPTATLARPSALAIRVSTVYIAFAVIVFFAANGGFFRFLGLGTPVWLLAYCVVSLWFIRAPRLGAQAIMRAWPLFMLPAFAMVSTVWSVEPSRSLIASVYFFMTTLIAVRIGMILNTRQIMIALLIGVGAGVALSLVNMQIAFFPPVYEERNGALIGIYSQKTQLAKAAFWTAFAAVALGAFYRIRGFGLLVTLICLPVPFWALSVTGKMGFLFVGLMMLLIAMRRLPVVLRLGLPLALMVLLLSYAVIHVVTGGAIMDDLLDLAGKDSTLTGRALLWAVGGEVWSDSPLVGIGFNAFWYSAAYAPLVNLISARLTDGLVGFHNAYIESFVALGVLGGLWFIGLVVVTLVRLLRAYVLNRSLDSVVWLCAVAAVAGLGFVEDSFFKPHSGHWMLFALGYWRSITSPTAQS